MSKMKWATGAAMLACTGALVACGFQGQAGGGKGTTAVTSESPAAVRSESPPAVQSGSPAASGAVAGAGAAVLSGRRQVTIVRAQAFESGLSLTDRLVEVDDDSGRQLFVPTPLGQDRYLIKAYAKPSNRPAASEPACWQVHNPKTSEPLTVKAAPCDAGNRDQWFTITARDKQTYAISNASAFLQYSPTSGLILEELGDAPLRTTFRFVDNGPAPTFGG
jgi:hypothetical protein